MKVRTEDPKKLTDFKLLAFDVFGTLVDWESGIYDELQPLRSRLPASHPLKNDRNGLISAFNAEELTLTASKPKLRYSTLLEETLTNLLQTLGLPAPSAAEAHAVGASVGKWPAFPDTVRALNAMQKYYKLVPLTNCDVASFDATLAGPLKEVNFDAVYIAEKIGSYKPDHANFTYLLEQVKEEFGVLKEEVLMTAHGLGSDHVPCLEMGISSAWIARGDGDAILGGQREGGGNDGSLKDMKGKVGFTWVFDTAGDMAAAAEQAFAWEKKQLGGTS